MLKLVESHPGVYPDERWYNFATEDYILELVVSIRHGGYHEIRCWYDGSETTWFHVNQVIPGWRLLGLNQADIDEMRKYALAHGIKE